jgi:hypothetical protein
MSAQLELARRPQDQLQVEDLPPVRESLLTRFLGWVDPPAGTVATGGVVARGLVCVVLCLVAALAIVGALTGLALGIASIL